MTLMNDYDGLTFEQLAKHAKEGWELAEKLRADLQNGAFDYQNLQKRLDDAVLQADGLQKTLRNIIVAPDLGEAQEMARTALAIKKRPCGKDVSPRHSCDYSPGVNGAWRDAGAI